MTSQVDRADDRHAFRVTAAGCDGQGRGTFRTKQFRAPTTGVRVPSSLPDDLRTHCAAMSLVLPKSACFAGPTAARLWDLPLPLRSLGDPRVVHIAVPAEQRVWIRRRGVIAHRVVLGPGDRAQVQGLPVTTVARTFVDLGARWALPDLVALGDAALRGELTTAEDLKRQLGQAFGARGTRLARRAITLLNARSESPMESWLRVVIIEDGLPVPLVNAEIRDAYGGFLARGDLVYPQWRIVIEYDGVGHLDEFRRRADGHRRTLLRENGWYVVEINADDLRHPHKAIAKIRGALADRRVAA